MSSDNIKENSIPSIALAEVKLDVVPDKILNTVTIQDGLRYYQVRWKDSWLDERILCYKYSFLISEFWIKKNQCASNVSSCQTKVENTLSTLNGNVYKKIQESFSNHNGTCSVDVNKITLSKDSTSTSSSVQIISSEVLSGSKKDVSNISTFRQADEKLKDSFKTSESVICPTCKKVLSSARALKRHNILKHLKNGRYKCKDCSKRFSSATELSRHSTVHSNIKKHVCQECGKAFKQAGQLLNHKRIHENKRDFTCEDCGQKFYQQHLLKCHMNSHSLDKEFLCELCGKDFKRKCNLYAHVRNFHSMKLNSICVTCAKGTTTFVELASHLDEVHDVKIFECSKCDDLFFSEEDFSKHTLSDSCIDRDDDSSSTTKTSNKCPKCMKYFPSIDYLSDHMKKHKSICYLCKKSFKLPRNLQNHLKVDHGIELPLHLILPGKDENDDPNIFTGEQTLKIDETVDREKNSVLKLPTVSTLIVPPNSRKTSNLNEHVIEKNFIDIEAIQSNIELKTCRQDAIQSNIELKTCQQDKNDACAHDVDFEQTTIRIRNRKGIQVNPTECSSLIASEKKESTVTLKTFEVSNGNNISNDVCSSNIDKNGESDDVESQVTISSETKETQCNEQTREENVPGSDKQRKVGRKKRKHSEDEFFLKRENLLNCSSLQCVTCGTNHSSQIELMCHLMSVHKSELLNINQEKPAD